MLRLHPDVVDLLVTDEGALVMLRGELLRLGPVAALIAAACATPMALEDLAERCEKEFGVPPGADTLTTVRELVGDLVGSGVLTGG